PISDSTRRRRDRTAARRWGAPACPRARRCAPKCAPARKAVAGSGVALPEDELTGALPARPVPMAALVTGGAKRIGRAIARALAEAGYAVALHHHQSRSEATALVAEITAKGGKAVALAADLADEAAVTNLLPEATAALGPIGVLVNNASIFENDTVANASREGWDAHMAINLRAPFVLTQQFAALLPAGAGGA